MDKRKVEGSQEDYCRGCILNVACNVVLKDGESCGDRVSPAPRTRVLINGEAYYDKGSAWYRENAERLVDRRPATTVTLQEETKRENGEWETIAEIKGESALPSDYRSFSY
jgi:hypothetical protein